MFSQSYYKAIRNYWLLGAPDTLIQMNGKYKYKYALETTENKAFWGYSLFFSGLIRLQCCKVAFKPLKRREHPWNVWFSFFLTHIFINFATHSMVCIAMFLQNFLPRHSNSRPAVINPSLASYFCCSGNLSLLQVLKKHLIDSNYDKGTPPYFKGLSPLAVWVL